MAYYSASESSADIDWESHSDANESEADTSGDMNNLEKTKWLINPNSVKDIPKNSIFSYSIKGLLDDPLQKHGQGFFHPLPNIILAHMCIKVQDMHEDRYGEYLSQCGHETIQETLQGLLRFEAKAVLNTGVYTREK